MRSSDIGDTLYLIAQITFCRDVFCSIRMEMFTLSKENDMKSSDIEDLLHFIASVIFCKEFFHSLQ